MRLARENFINRQTHYRQYTEIIKSGLELVALAAIYGDDVDRHAEYISVATNIVVIFKCKTLSAKNRNGSRKLTKGAYVVLYPASVERSIEEL